MLKTISIKLFLPDIVLDFPSEFMLYIEAANEINALWISKYPQNMLSLPLGD